MTSVFLSVRPLTAEIGTKLGHRPIPALIAEILQTTTREEGEREDVAAGPVKLPPPRQLAPPIGKTMNRTPLLNREIPQASEIGHSGQGDRGIAERLQVLTQPHPTHLSGVRGQIAGRPIAPDQGRDETEGQGQTGATAKLCPGKKSLLKDNEQTEAITCQNIQQSKRPPKVKSGNGLTASALLLHASVAHSACSV